MQIDVNYGMQWWILIECLKGMGATVCTAGRFLLVAPFTKLDEEEDEEEAESVAPVNHSGRDTLERTDEAQGKVLPWQQQIYWVYFLKRVLHWWWVYLLCSQPGFLEGAS